MTCKFDDDAASKMFPATIYDGHGMVFWEGLTSFSDLLANKLVYHLSLHIKQIQALRDGDNQWKASTVALIDS